MDELIKQVEKGKNSHVTQISLYALFILLIEVRKYISRTRSSCATTSFLSNENYNCLDTTILYGGGSGTSPLPCTDRILIVVLCLIIARKRTSSQFISQEKDHRTTFHKGLLIHWIAMQQSRYSIFTSQFVWVPQLTMQMFKACEDGVGTESFSLVTCNFCSVSQF